MRRTNASSIGCAWIAAVLTLFAPGASAQETLPQLAPPASQPAARLVATSDEDADEDRDGPESAAPERAGSRDHDERVFLNRLDNFHAIEPGRAYRSAQLSAEKLRHVARTYGICTVINLRGPNPQNAWYRDERRVCEELGLRMVDIPLSASELPSRANLLRLFDAFRSADGPVLLHCKSGADRSGMAAAMWRMTMQDVTSAEALDQVGIRYGHLRRVHPEMSQAVSMFVPERSWIEMYWPVP